MQRKKRSDFLAVLADCHCLRYPNPLASDVLKERRNVEFQQYDQINTTFSLANCFFNMARFLDKVKELQWSTAREELSKIHSLWLATLANAICAGLIRWILITV